MKKLFLIYGDQSAEFVVLNIVRSLREIDPSVEIKGIGSRALLEEGVEIIYDLVKVSVAGLWEVIKKYPFFKKVFRGTLKFIREYQPQAVILFDYPGFNLRICEEVKKINRKIKIIYCISPQIWAWRKERIEIIKRNVDLMLVIFKFEEEFYKKEGVNVKFIGYPRTCLIKEEISSEDFKKRYSLEDRYPLIGLMPGSRYYEVKYNLPPMIETMQFLYKDYPEIAGLVLKAPSIKKEYLNSFIKKNSFLKIVEEFPYSCIKSCDFLIVCSGTSTLEVSLLKRPFVIVYRMNPLNYIILKRLVKVPFIGMVNLLLNKKLVPEFIQSQVRGEILYPSLKDYLDHPQKIEDMLKELNILQNLLPPVDFKKVSFTILENI